MQLAIHTNRKIRSFKTPIEKQEATKFADGGAKLKAGGKARRSVTRLGKPKRGYRRAEAKRTFRKKKKIKGGS